MIAIALPWKIAIGATLMTIVARRHVVGLQ